MSRRSKKRVDYTQFGAGDDDDDFAEFTPPASKRQKTAKKEIPNKSSDKEDKGKRKSRPSIDDKLYERELQAALELSIIDSQPSPKPAKSDVSEKENVKDTTDKVMDTQNNVRDTQDSVKKTKENIKEKTTSVKTVVTKAEISPNKGDSDDEIVLLESGVVEKPKSTGRTPRRKATKNVVIDNDDDEDYNEKESDAGSDFGLEEDDESDDESDEDFNLDDDDFDRKGKKKAKSKVKETCKSKKTPAKSKAPVTKPPAKSKAAVKAPAVSCRTPKIAGNSLSKTSAVRSTPPVSRPSVASPMPRWNPPGPAANKTPVNSGVSLTSPSSGLRVGLSRNMKLKPLHPNLKIKQ